MIGPVLLKMNTDRRWREGTCFNYLFVLLFDIYTYVRFVIIQRKEYLLQSSFDHFNYKKLMQLRIFVY